MKNETQEQRIVRKLLRDGFVTRNECLARYISRLGAIICDLKAKGWEFKTSKVKGDYRYDVVKHPTKTIRQTSIIERDGQRFGVFTEKEVPAI